MPKYNSLQAFAAQQLANFQNATDANKVLRQAVIVVVPEMKRRIQNDGKKSDGSQIGKYSTKKLSFGKITNRFYDTATKKQLAARIKNNAKPGTFEGGYKQLRQERGLETSFVDLTFTGAMMGDLKAGPAGPNSYGIGFLSSEQNKIAGYNEKKYGVIFDLAKYELQVSLDVINRQAQKLLSK